MIVSSANYHTSELMEINAKEELKKCTYVKTCLMLFVILGHSIGARI